MPHLALPERRADAVLDFRELAILDGRRRLSRRAPCTWLVVVVLGIVAEPRRRPR